MSLFDTVCQKAYKLIFCMIKGHLLDTGAKMPPQFLLLFQYSIKELL